MTSSDLEARFDLWRGRAGLLLAPVLFLALWFAPLGLEPRAHKLAAILASVAVLWVAESIPMPVTALVAAATCVLVGVAPAKQVFAPFAEQLMFLFIGSFILARAIFLHGLDRRLAFGVMSLKVVGTSPLRILFAYGAVTAFISAWISNTATTAMMFAIGLSLLRFFEERPGGCPPAFATSLLLMTSFSASIGGLATPIGTPPNAIGLGFIRNQLNVDIPFFDWMLLGVPVVVTLYLFLFAYLAWFGVPRKHDLTGGDIALREMASSLGPWTTGQVGTLVGFVVMVSLWLLPGVVALVWGEQSAAYKSLKELLPEAVPALLGAGLLFLLPGNRGGRVLTWDDAAQIDWGVVLLYGGGFALGELSRETGLAAAMGQGLTSFLPNANAWTLVTAAALVAVLTSEATSNTAAANIVIPVVIPLAQAVGVDPLEPALAATLAASLGFMLPVSTPCNAIVYGSGRIPLTKMIRYGLLLDIAGVIVVVLLVRTLTPFVR
jgi:sodium-dependent dicarboxylate transporter 2/3/5